MKKILSAVFGLAVLAAGASDRVDWFKDDDGVTVKGAVVRPDPAGTEKEIVARVTKTLFAAEDAQPFAKLLLLPVPKEAAGAAEANAALAKLPGSLHRDWEWSDVEWVADESALAARIVAAKGPKPVVTSLDGAWKFRREILVKPDGTETDPGTGWETVEVPHDWAIRSPFPPNGPVGSGKLPWQGTGRYRRSFEVSDAVFAECGRGGKVYLEFDGAMARPEVFVNGTKAGGWNYGYMSFVVDATPFVKAGANELEVFCDTRRHRSRWYPGGGLYRSVRMKALPREHVVPYSLAVTTPVATKEKAIVRVRYTSSVRGPVEYCFNVVNPRLWDVDDPHLYELDVLGEKVRYGIRRIEWTADDGFHLNGRRVQLYGVDLHADMGPLGMAFNRSVMRRQLQVMKDMGANALRTSHNAPDPQVLDLCDEMGILVWNECFDKWNGTAGRYDDPARRDVESVEDYVGPNLVQFVKRDRNHPCVIAWSQSNEIAPANAKNPAGLTRARCALFRKMMLAEDDTRPIGCGNVGHGCCPSFLTRDLHADLDITGWNYGAAYRRIHGIYPKMPLVYTESASAVSAFGAYENPPANGRHDWPAEEGVVSAYDHNAGPDIPDVEFERMEQDRYCAGEFVWTGIDYLGEPYPYTVNQIGKARNVPVERLARSSYYGICDLNAYPKDRYWLYRSYWKPDAFTLHVLPHWNWAGREGTNVPVYVYTNGDEAELFLNGRSLGRRRKGEVQKADPTKKDFRGNRYYEICDKYRLRWLDVPYEPGELKVVAYRKGAKLGEKVVRTAGKSVRVQVTPEQTKLPADGKTVVFAAVDLVDAAGVRDPLATDRIAVKVEGPGDLLSVSNGDARDLTSFVNFDSYPLYYGKAFVTLRRRAGQTGRVTLTVSCAGREPARVVFE